MSALRFLEKISEDEYLVAKRKRGLGILFFLMIICGFCSSVVSAFCLLFIRGLDFETIITILGFIVGGIVIFALGIHAAVVYFKTPKIAITFKRGNFYFGKYLKCNPTKLGDISSSQDGTLYFSVNGEKCVYHYIANVSDVAVVIFNIKRDYTQYIYAKKKREQEEKSQPAATQNIEQPKQIIQPVQEEQPVQPVELEQSEEPELVEEAEQFEQPEQVEESEQAEPSEDFESFENIELSAFADKIELPDMPDLPDLPD